MSTNKKFMIVDEGKKTTLKINGKDVPFLQEYTISNNGYSQHVNLDLKLSIPKTELYLLSLQASDKDRPSESICED